MIIDGVVLPSNLKSVSLKVSMMKVKSNNSNVWLGGNSILSELNNSRMDIELNEKHNFSGFEISDVLRISDKDYSVTFGLYFSVEWFEPRLNLSSDLWGEGRVASDTELIPGESVSNCSSLGYGLLLILVAIFVPLVAGPSLAKN